MKFRVKLNGFLTIVYETRREETKISSWTGMMKKYRNSRRWMKNFNWTISMMPLRFYSWLSKKTNSRKSLSVILPPITTFPRMYNPLKVFPASSTKKSSTTISSSTRIMKDLSGKTIRENFSINSKKTPICILYFYPRMLA